ncbi:483_t:CDS:2 [Cetraspora pellucida]|uniref:Multiple inositol polyphosphate phosphatase 1 n=1 Tax=Cetraspora pellucida TaxID=1433469 RepID=A0A9N8W2F2_9GLOM|nr:483_t:CDS:2 [Cetraspora pellucida]
MLCSENEPFLYERSPEYLINNHFFEIRPTNDAFSLDIKPIDCPDGYTLKQLFLLARHGSRLPKIEQVQYFDKIDKAFANASVAKDWPKNPFTVEQNFRLTTRGKIEPYFLGLQSLKRYEKFWKNVEYDADVGLFDGTGPIGTCKNEPVFIWSLPQGHDYILEMYNACPLWNHTIGNNFTLYTEQTYSYGNKTLAPIAERLTKKYNINPPLDPNLIPYLFYYCEFYVLQFNRTDTWCGLLSDDDLTFGRYYWNMRDYYQYSYGNPFNEKLGCAYITQFVNSVEDYLNGKSRMVADIKFGHGFNMQVVFATLGVFKNDYPLTADLTLEQIKNLKYIEQKVLYWSSTAYFEIYTSSGKDTLFRLVVNSEPYIIPGCGEYCEWSKFKDILSSKINCDFEKLCAYP